MDREVPALGDGDPRRLGPYRLTRVLGAGGMGKVYLGRDAPGRPVAVKVLLPELAQEDSAARRFQREAWAARAVRSRGWSPRPAPSAGRCPDWRPATARCGGR